MVDDPVKIAAWIPVPRDWFNINPWDFPDSPWPREPMVLFPRVERARIATQIARSRLRGAWSVLRGEAEAHTDCEREDWDW